MPIIPKTRIFFEGLYAEKIGLLTYRIKEKGKRTRSYQFKNSLDGSPMGVEKKLTGQNKQKNRRVAFYSYEKRKARNILKIRRK